MKGSEGGAIFVKGEDEEGDSGAYYGGEDDGLDAGLDYRWSIPRKLLRWPGGRREVERGHIDESVENLSLH